MSARERRRFNIHEERLEIYRRDRGICQTCELPVSINEFEVAHRIADTGANRKRWGSKVIDSPINKRTTHRGACNDGQNIGFNPVASQALADLINAQEVQ